MNIDADISTNDTPPSRNMVGSCLDPMPSGPLASVLDLELLCTKGIKAQDLLPAAKVSENGSRQHRTIRLL